MILNRLLTIALLSGALHIAAQPTASPNVLDLRQSITDSNIVYPESFETDAQRMLEGWYLKNYTASDDRGERLGDTEVPDAEVKRRLAALPTVIDMPFNQIVRSYIDRYTRNARAQVGVILGLSHYYMPIFEQALEERGLPLELKYLPVIESGLDPNAVSKHGATGLWQFMVGTAKGLGMEVNSLVDERRDPYAASAAAANYLKELYDTYGDWSLALAAYNCGPGTVNKAIRRAGGDPKSHDFWSIYHYLTPETRGYVPMFIAANYVMAYYPQHNISPVLATKPLVTDTIQVSDRVHFNQIAEVLDIPVDELRILNPQFRADLIPGSAESPYTLILPSQQVHAYILSEAAIKAHDAEKYARREEAEPAVAVADATVAETEQATEDVQAALADAPTLSKEKKLRTVVHKVQPGETLAAIAKTYQVSVDDIKAANGLRRNALRAGQQLRINTATAAGKEIAAQAAPAKQTKQAPAAETPKKKKAAAEKKAAATKPTVHNIKSGETLSSVAKKYGVTVEQLKKENGLKSDALSIGQKLNVPVKGSAKASTSKTTGKKTAAKKTTSKKKRRK